MKFQWRTSLVFGYVFMLLIFFSSNLYAQNAELSQRLQGKVRLKDIMQQVDEYYRNILGSSFDAQEGSKKKQIVKEYKRWKRWEWYHSARLNPDGSIADASKKILEALDGFDNNSFGRGNNPGDPSSLTNSGAWTNMGPSSTVAGPLTYLRGLGRCDRITFHPTNPLTYYVSTPAGGLWRTTNDGSTWTNLSDELPTMGISGMVVSHADPNTLYILTGDGDSNTGGFVEGFGYIRWSQGVFRSIDGGSTWQKMGAFPSMPAFYSGFKLVQSPDDANALLAATSSGLFRTTNAGLSWQNVSPTGFTTAIFHDVEFSPGGFTTAYAVATLPQGSYFCRGNTALNFTRTSTSGLPGNNGIFSGNGVIRYAIGVSNADPELVVLLAGPSVDSTGFQGIFVSTSGGSSFVPKANTPNVLGGAVNGLSTGDQSSYDHCVAVAPNDAAKIVTGGLCVWRSDNGGTSLSAISKYFEATVGTMGYIHPDVHDVAYNPLNNYLYACTDGGVYKSIDHGNTWTNISTGLIVTQYYHLAGITSDVNKLLGGAQDNGTTYRKTNSSQFTHIRGADGHRTSINSTNSNIIYWTENESICRSNDAGVANINYILPVTTNAFYPAFRLNPSNQSKVYIGTGHKLTGNQKWVFYHSDDGGFTYIDSTTINVTKDLVCAPSDVNVLYGTDGFNIWRSQNEGYSFQLKVTGLPAARAVTSLAVNPNNSAIVVATLGGFTTGEKVYYTVDAGVNWQNLSGTLPNVPVTSAAVNNNGDVYIGTDIGVFYQAEAESDWRPFYNGLPRVPVTELIIYPNSDLIRAATFGRGIWQTSLYTTCPPNANFTTSINTPRVYNAGTSIVTTQNILGSAGINVLYKAGSFITMNPGFRATENAVMNAKIGPCLPGIDPSTQLRKVIKVSGAVKVLPLPPDQTQKTGPKEIYY